MDEQSSQRRLSPEELEIVKEQVLESVYADIGRDLVKKILWVLGALGLALVAWLTGKGYLKIEP